MQETNSRTLYLNLLEHIRDNIIKAHENAKAHGRRVGYKDLPAKSVGCECLGIEECGDSVKPALKEYYHDMQLTAFEVLNPNPGPQLNQRSIHYPECKNRIGRCAENIAAGKVLKRLEGAGQLPNTLSELSFTEAFDGDGMRCDDWCKNCHTIYD